MNKICTTIEQSKKLSEILPIESADMMWDDWSLIDEGWRSIVGYYPEIEKDYGRKCYPAWSLVALLDQLEDVIVDENGYNYQLQIIKEGVQYYLVYEGVDDFASYDTSLFDDLVDACVEMILKLKEKDLL